MEENNQTPAVDKKTQKALKIAKRRSLKNFGWWLFGFLSPALALAITVGVCGGVLPIKVVLRDSENKYVDETLGNETLLTFILNYQNYSVSSVPAIKLLLKTMIEDGEFGKYVSVDYDKLDEVKFDEINFEYIFQNCIEVTATLRSVGAVDSLGSLANLKTLTTNTPVEGTVDTTAPDFNPCLYYYMVDGGRLKRAYDNDKNLVPEAEGQQLYFPALVDVPVLDLMGVFSDRLSMEGVTDMLSAFTTLDSESAIYKLFKDYTIKTLGSFDINTIQLSLVLANNEGNKMIYNILCSAVGNGCTADTITIGDLQNIDINKVKLVDVMENNSQTEMLLETIRSACGKDSVEEVTIGDLYSANMGNIALTTIIPYSGNESLYSILCQATEKSDYTTLTVDDMSNFDFNKILLSTVAADMPDDLKTILVKACGVASFDDLTLADMKNFNVSSIPLSSVIENNADNATLIKILMQSTGASDYNDLTVASLSGFSLDNVLLTTVMPDNDSLFTILSQATGVPKDSLTVSSLSSFNISDVKLNAVIDSPSGNPIIDALLSDDTVTVGNIGDKINSLTLFEIYGEDCFTQDSTKTYTPGDHYQKVGNDFVIDTDGDYTGDYYVSKESGMMLLYCWSSSEIDSSTGRPGRYTPTSTSFSDFSSVDSSTITGSTIYELCASGILEDTGYSDNLKKRTLQEVITAASMILG